MDSGDVHAKYLPSAAHYILKCLRQINGYVDKLAFGFFFSFFNPLFIYCQLALLPFRTLGSTIHSFTVRVLMRSVPSVQRCVRAERMLSGSSSRREC